MYSDQLKSDFGYCESIIKKHSKSFYYAFSNLPPEKAHAVYAVYAFCRMADDSVDEKPTVFSQKKALNQLYQELKLFDNHQEPDHPLWRALRHIFNRYEMDIQPFYDQIKGQTMDINFSAPNTREELESYCYYVAGSVGLMLLPIIASASLDSLRQPAIELGIAMQITNILRDVGEDYFDKQRIYLPTTELENFNYSVKDLSKGVINHAFIALWETLAKRAEYLYQGFSSHINQFDADSQIPVALSTKLYAGILDAVRQNNYDCFSNRNYVSEKQKQQIIIELNH